MYPTVNLYSRGVEACSLPCTGVGYHPFLFELLMSVVTKLSRDLILPQPALPTRAQDESDWTPSETSGEPARRLACRSALSLVAVEAFVNDGGYGSSSLRWGL